MSLSSFLLPGENKGKAKAIDKGLDDLFRASAALPERPTQSTAKPVEVASTPQAEKKRKATEDKLGTKAKRSKSETTAGPSSSRVSLKASKHAQSIKQSGGSAIESEGTEDEYVTENFSGDKDLSEASDGEVVEVPSDFDDEDPSLLVHESLQKGGARASEQLRHGKQKHIPFTETPEQRDARTIFVGNVAVEVAKSRPAQKQLKRHILSFVPSAKIESIRFRSVAFKKPTAELPDDARKTSHTEQAKPREHARARATAWRADNNDEAAAAPAKQYLVTKEKKRIAFIKHEIHERVDAVNAYVVFAHPPSEDALARRLANLPPPPPVMDPYDAASMCANKCDGSMHLGRTLRVDVVKRGAHPRTEDENDVRVVEKSMNGDPKSTLFVGNLDFASKEEDLRAFFEKVVIEEKGKPGEQASDESAQEDEEDTGKEKLKSWVKRVRIIRDKDTQMGKGFAYVQFVDRDCVDEIIALEEVKLKFAKRKLRVQRCKTLPGGPKLRSANSTPRTPATTAKGDRPARARAPRLVPTDVPKGDPKLGAKLVHLPKEERKKVKAADADRVARRLAKKRAKALAEKGVKSRVGRERVRKRTSERKDGSGHDKEKPKKRVRSGKALMKLNTKK